MTAFDTAKLWIDAIDLSISASATRNETKMTPWVHVSHASYRAQLGSRGPYATRFNKLTGRCFLPA